jgi:hypothetical protein
MPPPRDPFRLTTSIHGNGCFSDFTEPVEIQHRSQGSFIIPSGDAKKGKVHYIIPPLPTTAAGLRSQQTPSTETRGEGRRIRGRWGIWTTRRLRGR